MKQIFTHLFILFGCSQFTQAQITIDTVTTGSSYSQNIWYSLENDNQAASANTSWDLALATSVSQSNPLTTAILVNHKIGSLYEAVGSNPSNFSSVDTVGLASWTPLYNSDTTWAKGAFNNTISLGNFDYGWGTYDMVTHSGINTNRVFVLKYTDGSCKKIKISLSFTATTYELTFSNIDNSNMVVATIDASQYSDKNFIYYSLNNGIIDREPLSSSWDLTFMQYPSFDYDPPYMVAGILQNVGVEIAQVYPVNDVVNYVDWSSNQFSNHMNVIGYDWKSYGSGWTIADSTVYFVKDKPGNLWKLIMTGFGGSSTGQYIFSKEKLSALSVNNNELHSFSAHVFPNPSTDKHANLIITGAKNNRLTVQLMDLSGKIISEEIIAIPNDINQYPLQTESLQSGVYLVNILSQNSTQQVKLLIY